MRNDEARGRSGNNGGLFSARSLSSYMRFVSSGASSAASTIRSAGATLVSSIANNPSDDSTRDQVYWAGFDKLELDHSSVRQVLLLGYKSGFQVWDVERSDDVRQLASRHDGPISFLQVQRNPNPNHVSTNTKTLDRFADSRPLLIVACDGSTSSPVGTGTGGVQYDVGQDEDGLFPSFVRFYSFKLHDYVHTLKFRSAVFSIRCSPRVVAVSQSSQIHCFNASTLEREYTILTYPIISSPGPGAPAGTGYGPLAVGPRWIAYSGNPVAVCDAGRVAPQILTPPVIDGTAGSTDSLSNGSLVAYYAKESSRQLANGLTTLGDFGINKLSKYYSKNGSTNNNNNYSPNNNGSVSKNGSADTDNAGTVIVRDVVTKQVIVQFRAHTSHISALCFDPSGTLLVTASVHGRNINVFRIMPPAQPTNSDASSGSYLHLYRLQRGLTNAVIKDISFSDDSEWIMISSSRGTSHLFAICPYCTTSYLNSPNYISNNDLILDAQTSVQRGGPQSQTSLQQKSLSTPGPPVTLSVVSRIRNGPGNLNGSSGSNLISGAVASAFYKDAKSSGGSSTHVGTDYLLVFSPAGTIVQYLLRRADQFHDINNNHSNNSGNRFVVEALQKWDVCYKKNRRDDGEIFDIYGQPENNNNNNMNNNNNKMMKYNNEESKHLYYISEVELHTHIVELPVWARSGMSFQVMSGNEWEELGGEVKIENISTRNIEMRSKDLIPVFDSLQMIRFHHNRVNNNNNNVMDVMNRQGSRRSSCSSIDYNLEGGADVASNGNHVNNNNNNVNNNNGINGGDHVSEARLQFGHVNNNNNNLVEASDLLPDFL